ncbi:MAG: hypothetical protein E7558_00185 [Ruminococcaceae bacterium]|nr:hypothetical protein [Oscillospiraceae bacterium]
MNEYIKRKDAEEYIKNFGKGAISDGLKTLDPVDDIVLLAKGIDMIPAADVVEIRHEQWKWGYRNGQYGIWCTNCGAGWVNSENTEWIALEHDYCPKCGAKMDKKEGAENDR